MVMAMLMLAGAGDEVHRMVMAMECDEWGQLAKAMKWVKWRQQWLLMLAGKSNGVRRMATSNSDGNGVPQVATAGSGDEVCQMATAMECVERRRQWSGLSSDSW